METLLVAVVVSVLSPMVLALLQNRQRRAEKREDWARQDEVAARVSEVAGRAVEAAAKVATVAEDLGTQHQEMSDRFDHVDEVSDGIHRLVDGRFTAALESHLDTLLSQAVLMRAERNISEPGAQAALRAVDARIESLQATLMERADP